MGMLDAPVRRPVIIQNYNYFLSQIGSKMTAVEIDDLTAQIKNSIDISDEEEVALLAQLNKAAEPVNNAAENDKVITAYQKDFATWYMSNILVISLVQWLFIFFLVLKLSK